MRCLVFCGLQCAFVFAAVGQAGSCESLSAVNLSKTSISVAQEIPAGTFNPPYGNPVKDLPAVCRIAGVIQPSADSYIRFEVWMPVNGWNGKYRGVGNGGFAGAIDFNSLGKRPARLRDSRNGHRT